MSETSYLPENIRKEFEKFDEEINFLKNIYEDLKTCRKMIKLRKYD